MQRPLVPLDRQCLEHLEFPEYLVNLSVRLDQRNQRNLLHPLARLDPQRLKLRRLIPSVLLGHLFLRFLVVRSGQHHLGYPEHLEYPVDQLGQQPLKLVRLGQPFLLRQRNLSGQLVLLPLNQHPLVRLGQMYLVDRLDLQPLKPIPLVLSDLERLVRHQD